MENWTLDTPYEPWVPEIGQRVRVLSRPECFYCREEHDIETGATGVVSDVKVPPLDDDPAAMAHRFWVDFDDQSIGCGLSHFAAIELEPAP